MFCHRLTVLLCASLSLLADIGTAQSCLNSLGLGEVTGSGDAANLAIGDPYALSNINFGNLVELSQTELAVAAVGNLTIASSRVGTRAVAAIRPVSFWLAAPLPLGLRLGGSLQESFNQDFDIWSDSAPDIAYRRHIIGRGGIYGLRAGLTKAFINHLGVAVTYKRVIGGAREDWRFEIDNARVTSVDTIEIDYSGNTFELSAAVRYRPVVIAGLYEPSLQMVATRYRLVHGIVSDSTVSYQLRLPQTFHLAVRVSPTDRIAASLGLTMRPWSGATVQQNQQQPRELGFRNSSRASIGVDYRLTSGEILRAGFAVGSGYYDVLAVPMVERSVHLGASVPVRGFGSLDVAGEIVSRRTSLSETAARLTLQLSYGERWERRVRRWGY